MALYSWSQYYRLPGKLSFLFNVNLSTMAYEEGYYRGLPIIGVPIIGASDYPRFRLSAPIFDHPKYKFQKIVISLANKIPVFPRLSRYAMHTGFAHVKHLKKQGALFRTVYLYSDSACACVSSANLVYLLK